MIDPKTVLVATPTLPGTIESACVGGLIQCAAKGLYANWVCLDSCSDISLARDKIVNGFLQSEYQYLVFVDSDIGFSDQDFELLMDYPGADTNREHKDTALVRDASFDRAGNVMISCAEYARKIDNTVISPISPTVRLGLGFCRISREVFSILDDLNNDDGTPRIEAYFFSGQYIQHYFLSGAFTGHYFTEDTGFFTLCKMAGITPKIETRTRLTHHGKKVYSYKA